MSVYFIQEGGCEGHVKIGYTLGSPLERLRSFRTGNPRPLALLVAIPGARSLEVALHARFADLRIAGEWFRADARLLGFIEGMLIAHPEQPKDDGTEMGAVEGLDCRHMEAIAGWLNGRKFQDRWAEGQTIDGYRGADWVIRDFLKDLDSIEDYVRMYSEEPYSKGFEMELSPDTARAIRRDLTDAIKANAAALHDEEIQ